jgi:ubiquinone/menaquinone biosynthesis C-methylase UbiE
MTQKMVGGSVSFDPAAEVYDATRGLDPWIVEKQTEAILAELRAAGAQRLLEVGVGTGRITRPVMERGVRVAGIDLAPRMIARLREQLTARHTPPDLLYGDATRLPLRDGSFPAVLMVHVLHLVADWKATIAEMRRVLAPEGVFLHDVTNYDVAANPWKESLDHRDELFAKYGVRPRARPSADDIVGALRGGGGTQRIVVYARDQERNVPQHLIDRVRTRTDSWTWEIPDEIHEAFLAEFEHWCRAHFGDLQRVYVQPVHYELQVWTFAR